MRRRVQGHAMFLARNGLRLSLASCAMAPLATRPPSGDLRSERGKFGARCRPVGAEPETSAISEEPFEQEHISGIRIHILIILLLNT